MKHCLKVYTLLFCLVLQLLLQESSGRLLVSTCSVKRLNQENIQTFFLSKTKILVV